MRLRALLVAVCLALGGMAVLPGATASAAPLPTCNGSKYELLSPHFRIERLIPTYNGSGNCTLRLGDYDNPGVSALQWTLIRCYSQPIAFDGDFGPATRGALINAQTWETGAGNGVYTPVTRDNLLWPYREQPTQEFFGCRDLH